LDEIIDISDDKFKGVFHISYEGTFAVEIQTLVQVNLTSNTKAQKGEFIKSLFQLLSIR